VHYASTSWPGLSHGCPVRQDRLQSSGRSQPSRVVPGLVPGIHAERKPPTSKVYCNSAACGRMLRIRLGMAGTSPAKTPRGSIPHRFSRATRLFSATGQPWHKAGHDVLGLQKPECCSLILFPGQPCAQARRRLKPSPLPEALVSADRIVYCEYAFVLGARMTCSPWAMFTPSDGGSTSIGPAHRGPSVPESTGDCASPPRRRRRDPPFAAPALA
jgi:hypothetical protein